MNNQEFLTYIKKRAENRASGIPNGIPISLKGFSNYFSAFDKQQQIIIAGDSGVSKSTWTLKHCILDVIDYILSHPNIDGKIYYVSVELSQNIVLAKIYQHIIFKTHGIKLHIFKDLLSPTPATLKLIESCDLHIRYIESKLEIIDTLKSPTEIYNYVKKEVEKTGTMKNGRFIEHNPNFYNILICDTIDALIEDPGLNHADSIRRWSRQYCKLSLRNVYNMTLINVQQLDKNSTTSQYANTGAKIEEKFRPSLASLATVKTTPNDASCVVSLMMPARYGIQTWEKYPISAFGNQIVFLEILKDNFGATGVTSALYFEPLGGDYEELPAAANKQGIDDFLKQKKLGNLYKIP